MKHYYLFNNASRAAQYGIGTYLNQLSHGLKEEAKVSIISINSDKEEVKSTEDNGIRTIHIPEISYKNSSDNFQRYYRNLISCHSNILHKALLPFYLDACFPIIDETCSRFHSGRNTNSDNVQRYYRNLIYLLKTLISEEEAVFMLNYLYMTPLVKLLHEHFLNCKVVAVVHYLNTASSSLMNVFSR